MARNSARSSIQMPAAWKKVSTRYSAAYTGLRAVIDAEGREQQHHREQVEESRSRTSMICCCALPRARIQRYLASAARPAAISVS